MRPIVAWLAVSAFFVAINAIAAGLMFGVFALGQRFAPSLMEEPLVVVPLGLLGVAGAIWVAFIATRLLSRVRARA